MIRSWPYVVLIYINYSRDKRDTKLSSVAHDIALMSWDSQFRNLSDMRHFRSNNMRYPSPKTKHTVLFQQPSHGLLSELKIIQPISSLVKEFFLIRIVGGGDQLGPLGTAATNRPIVPAPGDYEDGEIGGMMIGRDNPSTRRKPAPVPLFPPQIPHDLTGRRGGKPATNRLSYGTALVKES
jgi:hypothetical protein